MEFFETVQKRRSIRKFTSEEVADDMLDKILECGRIAPSGSNAQPWKFLVVRNPETRSALQKAAANQPFVGSAPVVIAVLGDRKAFKKRLRTGKQLAEIGAVDPEIMSAAAPLYKRRVDNQDSETRSIFLNCAIAADHMVLAATALGLGSCWVMLMDSEEVADVLKLPEHLFPVALLPIGYPAQDPAPRPRYGADEVFFEESLDTPRKTGETFKKR